MKSPTLTATLPVTVIGYHECIGLPELGFSEFAIKVDTGAKTTALHAENIESFDKDEQPWVRFRCATVVGERAKLCEFPIHTTRAITNTSGVPETRIVIRTLMILASRRWRIDISLTDRGSMKYPLILGRRALRKRNIVVHPGKTYLVSNKPQLEGSTS